MKRLGAALLGAMLTISPLAGQDTNQGDLKGSQLVVEPQELTLEVGEKAQLKASVKDAMGGETDTQVVFFSRSRRDVGVNAAGEVEAYRPGEFTVVALVPKDPRDQPRRAEAIVKKEITVRVPQPPIAKVSFRRTPANFYAGTTLGLELEIVDEAGFARPDFRADFSSSNPEVAVVDEFGHLTLIAPGQADIAAKAESAADTLTIRVSENPVRKLKLSASAAKGRTGDVIRFEALALDASGRPVEDFPVNYFVRGETHPDILAAGASAQIRSDGRFVAERAGQYTVLATAGDLTARKTVEVTSRHVRRQVEVLGQGKVRDRRTSDLWVWEGADGRDYAITGTWGADGHAFIWDVTDPRNISKIDIVKVDARTVNDVKVNEAGTTAVISREGASSRKNGIVILDVSQPQKGVRIISEYTDQLTGGVHNVFIHDNHVYALSAGRRYDILNIDDPENPVRVGRFELDTPGHSIHDVWVVDGIAYSSNWDDGVVVVDVGGGGRGGSPKRPVLMASYAYPSGWNHAAFPYRSQSTGKFYVFAGDEAFPYGSVGDTEKGGKPLRAAGWIHVIEWDDWSNPREVARYQVPEAGSHNFWVEGDKLYIGYYNAGLRVVDVSGELMGDLYKQGREIAFWHPFDPEGYSPNAPFTWGPMPHKGTIFLSDWNSGLWAVKLGQPEEKKPGEHKYGEPQ